MAFTFRQPGQSPDVKYHGKTLPADKATATSQTPQSPDVPYDGKQLPRDKVTNAPPAFDATNNPSVIIIGGVTLPPDTVIIMDFEKLVPGVKILDGVYAVQYVGRKPYEFEFEGTFRRMNVEKTVNVFPQDAVDDLFQNVWIPNTVQKITNTLLNRLGIQEIIITKGKGVTVRGSTNVPFKLWAIENQVGTTLIVGG